MSNSNNLIYFNSGAIRVFPSAYRGFKPTKSAEALDADPVVWNADASLTTEYNLTHMFSHLLGRQSFIISSPEKGNEVDFKCVINGYYFEIARDAFCTAYEEFYDDWLETLRGERRGCLCIRLLPKFEKGANGETLDPATADFNLTSLVSMELTQTSEGYLLDNESGEFTGLAFCPNATVVSSLSATLTDGSVLYSLPLNDESLYAETVYQEVKEKIIEGVKAVNWSKHLEVAPLSVGFDSTINLNSYSGTSNLHTFYVGDLKTLCNSGLSGMVNFPSALESALGPALSSTTTDEAATPNLLLALEVFDPGIGSTSSPKTSPVIQILHTFGYSKAKIAVEYTPEKDQTVNEIADWMGTRGIVTVTETDEATKTSTSYYTKTFDSDCCTFIRYGNRDNELKTAWGPWEGLSEEELKLFACVRAVEAEKRLADDLISGNIIPRFAERLKIYAKTESSVSTSLNPGWYYYPQTSISALAFLGGADMLDSTVSWEQKQLLNDLTRYAALLEVIGDDERATNPRLQRVSIFNSNNEVVASCSRVVSGTSNKWTFDITSANIQEQFVARADKQKVHQIADYAGLKELIKTLYEHSVRDTRVSRCNLQVELQFIHSDLDSDLDSDLLLPSATSNYYFHLVPGTLGHLITSWTTNGVFQLSLEIQKSNGISFSQTLSAELEVSAEHPLESALESLRWKAQYPTNVQNPIPLNNYRDLTTLREQLEEVMPFGRSGEEAVSTENNLSVPVVITESFSMEDLEETSADYDLPRGSIGYLAVLADQMVLENPDDYYGAECPFICMLSLLTPEGRSIIAHKRNLGKIIWEISEGHVAEADRASYAEVAGSVEGSDVNGKVSRAVRADVATRADQVYGKDVINAVRSATNAGTASKAFSLSLSSAKAAVAEDTDTGFGNSIFGSMVSTSVTAPGLYLVEVVLEHITGIALRDSTFFFIPKRSDLPAPETQQTLCNGTVTLTTTYYYSRPSSGDYDFESATFKAQGRGRIEGGVATDLAIKVWQIAEATGKANGPFQNN